MRYIIVAAVCHGRGLGREGAIPWKVPEDLRLFARMTKGQGGNAIVMGRKTWEGLPKRPLPDRANLVLSRNPGYRAGDGATEFTSIENLHEHCLEAKYNTVWVAGGAAVYAAFLKSGLVDRCAITFIDSEHECDTFFPKLGSRWAVRMARPIKTEGTTYAELRHLVHLDQPRSKADGANVVNDQSTDYQ